MNTTEQHYQVDISVHFEGGGIYDATLYDGDLTYDGWSEPLDGEGGFDDEGWGEDVAKSLIGFFLNSIIDWAEWVAWNTDEDFEVYISRGSLCTCAVKLIAHYDQEFNK